MLPNVLSTSPLIWTGLVSLMVALPVLIHLINMLRHRRVKWAAMDFLLVSYSRNRNWIWLRQLLLLLSRIAMLLFVLLMIGQIGCRNDELSQLESHRKIHHYVLLDDSLSMGERQSGQRLFDRALNTLQVLGTRIGGRNNQTLSLLRTSQAQFALAQEARQQDSTTTGFDNSQRDNKQLGVTQDKVRSEQISDDRIRSMQDFADLFSLPANSDLVERLQQKQTEFDISDLSMTAEAGLTMIDRWVRERSGESAIVYVVSDFRQSDWSQSTSMQEVTRRLVAQGARIHFVNCARTSNANLTITGLEPVHGMQVAGVPTFMKMRVRNQGEEIARSIQVRLQQTEYPARNADRYSPGEWTQNPVELPTVLFDEIAPGEEASQQFPVHFPSDGYHVISALLQDDALINDNRRDCVIDCRPVVNLLMVEDGQASQAYYLQSAFQPGRRRTGFSTSQRSYSEFQRMSLDEMSAFDSIALLAPQRFSSDAVVKLREYVSAGGGLTIYLGPNTDTAFLNASLYEAGKGLLPMPLDATETIEARIDETVADIVPMSEGLFQAFVDQQTSLLDLVTLRQYVRPPAGWQPRPEDRIEVLARVRSEDGDPLIMTRPFGSGQTCLVATSCSPAWNDWSANPTFVVCTLLLQESLVRNEHAQLNRQVGDVLQRSLPRTSVNPEIRVALPGKSKQVIETSPVTHDDRGSMARLGSVEASPWNERTQRAGVYAAWVTSANERNSVIRWATYPRAEEGELATASSEALLREFASARPRLEYWDEVTSDARRDLSTTLAIWFLFIVLGLVVLEQVLAYFTSFHPTRRRIQ